MFKAVRAIQLTPVPKSLGIIDKGSTTDPNRQNFIVTEHFKAIFTEAEAEKMVDIQPPEMETPFTKQEVTVAVKSLKNNKNAGIDDIKAEQLKYGPDRVYGKIAGILNITVSAGDHPQEMKHDVLIPLENPGKQRGLPSHLRPVLRKVFAICLIKGIGRKIVQQ